jgi:RNA polymerase sigma factor (sigma-70 family)
VRGSSVEVDSAFVAVFRTNATRVVRLAALLGAADPEDAAQEAFVRLYAVYGSRIAADADAGPYLNRVVVNLVRSRQRRVVVAGRRLADLAVASVHDSAEVTAVRRADRHEVLAALAALPHRRREAVVLRYWLDLPYADIADAMGVSPGTAKSLVSRGLAAIGRQLAEEDES